MHLAFSSDRAGSHYFSEREPSPSCAQAILVVCLPTVSGSRQISWRMSALVSTESVTSSTWNALCSFLFLVLFMDHGLTICADLHRRRELRWSIYPLHWYVLSFSSRQQTMTNAYENSKRSPRQPPRSTLGGDRDRQRLDRLANAVPRVHRVCPQGGIIQGRVGREFWISYIISSIVL